MTGQDTCFHNRILCNISNRRCQLLLRIRRNAVPVSARILLPDNTVIQRNCLGPLLRGDQNASLLNSVSAVLLRNFRFLQKIRETDLHLRTDILIPTQQLIDLASILGFSQCILVIADDDLNVLIQCIQNLSGIVGKVINLVLCQIQSRNSFTNK